MSESGMNSDVHERRRMHLQRIVGELAKLLAEMHVAGPADSPVGDGILRVGVRVRVVRLDKYYGREGIVISRRGKNYWNVRLKAVGERREVIMYKRVDSLVVCLGD